ncbi:hypothetical protein GNZ12_10195 [Paraburkholderia sp. 1N]|uniref:PXPV repeat-containing protein n=1 Tax=Paraburkholderia solitsugae TaxID=2675748 RepID=A0ABX2BM14_9BURK|nr:hypothetical protein [Paraburkholderia solitsugae]NPT41684.1 hypothetical protein [Paraburkholderia solitsugae]
MKTSITRTPDKGAMRARLLGALGLTLAIACLVTTAPLQAEEAHHGNQQQHGQSHAAPRQTYRHDDHHRGGHAYGNQDYAYGAPPVVYAPQEAPGISLFLPL